MNKKEHNTTQIIDETITFLEETLQNVKNFKQKTEDKINLHEELITKLNVLEEDVKKIKRAIV